MAKQPWKSWRQKWVPCPGYEGLYEVSNHGLVRRAAEGPMTYPGRPKKKLLSPARGVNTVKLWRDRNGQRVAVAPLICEAFHGPKPGPHHHVGHKDGNRTNDQAGNLQWELWPQTRQRFRDVLRDEQREQVRRARGERSAAALAEQYGVSVNTIYRIWRQDTGDGKDANRKAPTQA